MLGGSCNPCCTPPKQWYCYDTQYCGCADPQRLPEKRYFFAITKWTITQPSYGRFTALTYDYVPPNSFVPRSITYITRYTQVHFSRALEGPSGGNYWVYGGDQKFPSGSYLIYLGYDQLFEPRCSGQEPCQYSWVGENPGFGVPGGNGIRYFVNNQWFNSFFLNVLTLKIGCGRTGFSPTLDGSFVVGADVSTGTHPSTATFAGSAINGQDTQGVFRNFATDTSSEEDRVRWPPQPDTSAATITKLATDLSRCFVASWEISYPIKKWSVVPTDPSRSELLTVGSLLVRVGDVSGYGGL